MALNVAFAQGRLYLAPGERCDASRRLDRTRPISVFLRILSFYDDVELQVKGGSFQGKQTAKGTVYLTQYRVSYLSYSKRIRCRVPKVKTRLVQSRYYMKAYDVKVFFSVSVDSALTRADFSIALSILLQ